MILALALHPLVRLAVIAIVLVAIWMLVDHFVTDPTIKFVVKVVGGAFLLILAIYTLVGMIGWA
jgi:hypothetical protein